MKNFLILLVTWVFLTVEASATKFYVSTSGNNANSGLATTTAFLTIDKGINSAGNYDTVIVLPGTYAINAVLNINKPLTVLGQDAQIDGGSWSASTPNKRLLTISNTNDVLVDGFVFKNLIGDFSIGIFITGSGRNISISHCLITNIGWIGSNLSAMPSGSNNANGILIMGSTSIPLSQINIRNDTITNCALGFSEALTIVGNVDTFTIANNFVYANSNIGIDCAGSKSFTGAPSAINYARNGSIINNIVFRCNSPIAVSAGIYLDGAYNCLVEGNTLYENAVGISLGQESTVSTGAKSCSQNKVVNNVIHHNAVAGIIWGDNFGTSPRVINNIFANNTLFKNRTGAIINGVTSIGGISAGTGSSQYGNVFGGEILIHSCDSSFFDNNIVFPLGTRHCVVVPDAYIANNLLFNYNSFNRDNSNVSYFDIGAGASANGTTGIQTYYTSNVAGLYTNTVTGYPNFVDTLNLNFRLQSSPVSNCINTGNPTSTTSSVSSIDFAGNSRIFGTRIDIGAFESQTPLAVENGGTNCASSFSVTVFPNPGTGVYSYKTSEAVASIFVTDAYGRVVYQSSKPSSNIELTKLPNGIYQIELWAASGAVVIQKVSKL